MPDSFNKTYYYTKGVYEGKFFSNANRDLLYYDSKLTDGNIETSINKGEILAGIGNTPQIFLFDSARFNINLTAADINLRAYQLQTGGAMGYNGKTDTCEVITATSATISVSGTPVAPYGFNEPIAYINGDGTAYKFNGSTIVGFAAEIGKQYSVRYYIAKPASQVLDIKSLFTPEIGTMEVKYPIYSAQKGASALSGTIAGYLTVVAPRFQFNGNPSMSSNQTTAATTSLAGEALAYDDSNAVSCADSGLSTLVYMVWEPVDATSGVVDMIVLGGGEIEVPQNGNKAIPVRYVMKDGMLSVPDMADLTFTPSASGTVTMNGNIATGNAVGDVDVAIANTALGLNANCTVSVVSA